LRTSTSNCEFCGQPLPQQDYALPGHAPMLITLPCTCPEARAALERERQEEERQQRVEAFSRAWTRANIPSAFSHVDADFSAASPLADGKSVYLYGDNGRGKTYKACRIAKAYLVRNTYKAMGRMMCRKTCTFVTAQELFSRLKQSWERWDQTEEDVFQRWAGIDLLVLDDLGKGVPTEWAAENVFRLIDSRWSNNRPMVITSQYSITQLADTYDRASDETMAALISRLRGWCVESVVGGEDRRVQ